MANSKLNDRQVVTGEVRLSYVNLFEARKISESDKDAKFSVTILIPKDTADGKATIGRIKQAFENAAKHGAKHFGGRVPTNLEPLWTLKDGDTALNDLGDLKKIDNPEYAGHMYLRLSTKYAPKVLGPDNQEIINPLEVYSGMYGKVSLTCFAYSGDGRRGLSAVLNNVKITRDGEALVTILSGGEFE